MSTRWDGNHHKDFFEAIERDCKRRFWRTNIWSMGGLCVVNIALFTLLRGRWNGPLALVFAAISMFCAYRAWRLR